MTARINSCGLAVIAAGLAGPMDWGRQGDAAAGPSPHPDAIAPTERRPAISRDIFWIGGRDPSGGLNVWTGVDARGGAHS